VVTDLNGNPVTAMTPEFGVTGFTDSQGRVIEYGEAGVPVQRTETPRGPVFTPVEDLPTATELRPDLDPGVQARWTGAGAGPEGELYGADGTVIGRIDTDGTMRTLDGRVITGYTEPVGGRLPEITLEGGERVRTPGAGPAPERVDIAASGAGDDELADLVRRTGEAQAERAAAQGAETSAGTAQGAETSAGTAVGGDTEVSGPSEDTRATSGSAEGDTRVSGPDGGAPVDGDRVTDAAPPRSVETPGEVEGPRGGEALGTVLDAQGLLDQIEQEMAAGRSAQEAITRAVASTWASNAVGDVGEGVTDVRTTLLASALLPDGVNNILPDQFAANTMNTGLDAWSAIVADVAASLGEGEVNSEALDEFARLLTERSGADPWSGYAQLGEAFGEELGEADMNPVTMFGNLAEDLARMDEQDVIVEQGLDAASRFEQEAFDGQHGTVLRGISEATRVATDPPDPEQFAEDATTIARVLWDDVTGSGETGGMGHGFWEEIAEHNNDAVRGVPVVGTAFDGYAQIASGIEEQGVTGFSSEMAEGAAALAEEGATLAAETYAEARDAAFDQAVATYDAIAGWF
jgi:hypothetical protein